MDPKELKKMLGDRWQRVESYINDSLATDIVLLQNINGRILSHGGKQLRPLISMLVAMACSDGRAVDDSCRYAAAAELLHNATLLHDDVADESDRRRGVPTLKVSDGKLFPPELKAVILKLYRWPGMKSRSWKSLPPESPDASMITPLSKAPSSIRVCNRYPSALAVGSVLSSVSSQLSLILPSWKVAAKEFTGRGCTV